MDEILKALLLLAYVGADRRVWKRFAQFNIPPCALWNAEPGSLKAAGLTDNALGILKSAAASGWAEREYEDCARMGIELVSCESAKYPARLNDLKDPPVLLYWLGNAEKIPERTVGVVGTRRATPYGRETARDVGEYCARFHAAHISGGAAGIDGISHRGAIDGGGKSFAVFGNGVDVIYPSSNKNIFEDIREKGALISEFPLGTAGEAWRFPRRNRIVAALSEKLVVVEAPLKSGAMITARIALELGREVWAVPGRINDEMSEGCNRLIFDGAYPYIGSDIFFGVEMEQSSLLGPGNAARPVPRIEDLPPDEGAVLAFLWQNGGKTVDNIAMEVKMSAADVLKINAVLSAKGMIFSSGPGRYSAKA